ncbi:MAG: InlB B-repeat-containing protein [Paludibacteraceae bacterium]|nr:InlB B-repeat-containing protein [Paludibacteraceae bacterium]
MKKKHFLFSNPLTKVVVLSVGLLLSLPNAWAQSLPSELYVFAEANAKVNNTAWGKVTIAEKDESPADYQNTPVRATVQTHYVSQGGFETLSKLMDGGLQVFADYHAQPEDGYYFSHWVDSITAMSYTANPYRDSVLSAATTTDMGFSGAFCENNQGGCTPYYYPMNNMANLQDPDNYGTSYPLIKTLTAQFAAIPVRSCTDGQQVVMVKGSANKEWDVTFATSFARSENDFNEPVLSSEVTAGTFTQGTATFSNNVVTVPITFTPNDKDNIEEGNYTATLTLSSKGGLSLTVTIKVIVEEAVPEGVMTTVKVGNTSYNYDSWAKGLDAAQKSDGSILQVRRDISLNDVQTISGSFTLDLNGRTLTAANDKNALNINGGNLTIIDSKLTGKLTSSDTAIVVTTGYLILNRGEIKGATAVAVESGATFTMNDGILTATATGLHNNGGTVTVYSGEITAEAATNATGIYCQAGKTTLTGGTITATGTTSTIGINVAANAELNTTCATITANGAGENTYAVKVAESGNAKLGKNTFLSSVSSNETSGFAVQSASSSVTLDGVRLSAENSSENTSEISGTVSISAAYFVVDTYANTYNKAAGQTIYKVAAGQDYTDGYRFFLGTYDKAKENNVSICRIGNTAYTSLEDALLHAQNYPNEQATILMVNDYTLPAGYFTLPANAILVVPCEASQTEAFGANVRRVLDGEPHTSFCKLTFASGASLDVYGLVEASGKQLTGDAFGPAKSAVPTGAFGWILMEEGSSMTLESGAILYGWGFVTGSGEIEARRGSQVREFFQAHDWPGAGNAISICTGEGTSKKVFPLTQYFIQNVEAPVSYHPGARLYSSFAATARGMGITVAADAIQIVGVTGENAIFLMDADADADNTWVRKWYDVENDIQTYDINSGAHLSSLFIALPALSAFPQANGMQGFDSKAFVLPITSNFKIHLLTGSMDITQNIELLPGAEIEVDKESTVTVNELDLSGNPNYLFLYDADNWGKYAAGQYASQIEYTPSLDGAPTARDITSAEALGDAKVNIHGTLEVKGTLVTTNGGANIFSNNADAGTVKFTNAAPENTTVKLYQYNSGFVEIATKPAVLQNTDGQTPAYAETASTPAGQSYCFTDNKWRMMTTSGLFVYDNYGAWYVKPGAYVSIATQSSETEAIGTEPLENADHTYSDEAGEGRLFISVIDQWWEVAKKDNLYYCADNNKYYYWDDEDLDEKLHEWKEKKFNVTFVNYDGSAIPMATGEKETVYELSYGIMPKYNGTNPTRPENVDYTYTFTGWTPEFVPVTGDATYTATYEATQRKYTIIFLDENGTEIERHFLTRDEVPVCEKTPAKTGYFLTWSPGIGVVTGDQTYQAVFTPEPPTEFTVTFKNYDGSELKSGKIEKGQPIEAPATPTKQGNDEFSYSFTGWSPALEENATATKDITYVAQFSETRQKAHVTFKDENDVVLDQQDVEVGQTPLAPNYTKQPDAQYTYTVTWNNPVSAVLNNTPVTYKAVITPILNKYTITLKSNIPNACTFSGAGIYNYGTNVDISTSPIAPYNDPAQYDFAWSDNVTSLNRSTQVTGDITLTAMFKKKNLDDETVTSSVSYTSEKNVDNFIITSNGISTSGEITAGWDYLHIYGNADFKLQKHMDARHWYDIAVPWIVEANGGIYIDNSPTPAVLGTDIEIFYYDGSVRAKQGPVDACWVSVKNQSKKELVPGRAYLFLLYRTSAETITFRKKVQKPLLTTETSVQQYNSLTGDDKDGGWNGIANPALFKASLDAGTEDAQIINANGDGYEPFAIKNAKLVVGQPVYVQVTASKSPVVADNSKNNAAPARRMATNNRPARYEVIISAAGANTHDDRLIVRVDESKEEDAYVIGKDLAKFGTGSTVAQMWIDRYDAKLCVNTMAPEDDAAFFPMSVYAPKTGDYTIAIERATEADDYALYLTKNGEVIANLSDGAYTLDLQKGTTTIYGLRISARAPQVATDLGAAIVDADGKTTKVLYHGQVFIIRGEKIYTVDGQLVK